MPIQFSCTNCNKQLRVSDESAGKKAKCPQCQTVIQVPAATAASGLAGSAAPTPVAPPPIAPPFGNSPGDAATNPYIAPAAGIPHAKKQASGLPTAVGPGEVIEYAWNVWKQNLGILVLITFVVLVVNVGFNIVQNIAVFALAQEIGFDAAQGVGFLIAIVGNLIQIFLSIGQAQIVLKLLRGQPAEFAELFGGGSLFFRALGASIVALLAILVGFLSLIIRSFIMMLLCWSFFYFIVDRKAKAMESFSKAYEIGKLNIGTTFVLGIASMGISIAGMLACGVGILLAGPLVSAIAGTAYLMMSGQIGVQPKHQQYQ